jgi:spore maturation protein SpmB
MALFLAINTSSVTILPTCVIALLAAAGSVDPAAILPTTLFATLGSTLVAIGAARLYQRFSPAGGAGGPDDQVGDGQRRSVSVADPDMPRDQGYPIWVSTLALTGLVSVIPFSVVYGSVFSPWILPALMVGFLGFGLARGVKVYEVFVEGAKDGFQVALQIIPYMVAILVAVGMLKASGGLGIVVNLLGRVTVHLGLPPEALPMALMRPLSGSGAYGILASILNDPAIGPDSYTGLLVSTLQGSTETSFYVMAVYCGAAGIRRIRHSLAAALTADLAGVIFAVLACSLFLV